VQSLLRVATDAFSLDEKAPAQAVAAALLPYVRGPRPLFNLAFEMVGASSLTGMLNLGAMCYLNSVLTRPWHFALQRSMADLRSGSSLL
jgi:hypothetical protein